MRSIRASSVSDNSTTHDSDSDANPDDATSSNTPVTGSAEDGPNSSSTHTARRPSSAQASCSSASLTNNVNDQSDPPSDRVQQTSKESSESESSNTAQKDLVELDVENVSGKPNEASIGEGASDPSTDPTPSDLLSACEEMTLSDDSSMGEANLKQNDEEHSQTPLSSADMEHETESAHQTGSNVFKSQTLDIKSSSTGTEGDQQCLIEPEPRNSPDSQTGDLPPQASVPASSSPSPTDPTIQIDQKSDTDVTTSVEDSDSHAGSETDSISDAVDDDDDEEEEEEESIPRRRTIVYPNGMTYELPIPQKSLSTPSTSDSIDGIPSPVLEPETALHPIESIEFDYVSGQLRIVRPNAPTLLYSASGIEQEQRRDKGKGRDTSS